MKLTCVLCDTVTDESLVEHLDRAHVDEMLEIEVDPPKEVAVILGRSSCTPDGSLTL